MVLNRPVDALISLVGNKEVYHIQEAYNAALLFGYFVMPFERKWDLWDGVGQTRVHTPPHWWSRAILPNRKGFITGYLRSSGSGHCVAWDGSKIYDPIGLTYDLRFTKNYNFRPDTFHWISKYVENR